MTFLERAVRFPYNFILRRAPSGIKRRLWDREFASGKWDFIDDTSADCVYPYLEKYLRNGSILDLGCGPGNTANELPYSVYSQYVGVDISEVALNKARARTEQNGRSAKNRFLNADLLTFVPPQKFDVILMRESVYHVALGQIKAMFERYCEFLDPGGVFVVKLITENRYTPTATVRVIETEFEVVEKARHGGKGGATVIVFRSRRACA